MKSVQVIISDTHFGKKNNSQVWLESQMRFFNNTLIPKLKKLKEEYNVTLIHCGDLFDSRTSINPYIYHVVNNLITKLCQCVNQFVIIAGNHDFNSQVEDESYNINSLDMLHYNEKCFIITNESVYNDLHKISFIPWFEFHNIDKLKKHMNEYNPKMIFTHTDLEHLDSDTKAIIGDIPVFSGHIHIPRLCDNTLNLGSVFYNDFSDSNSERGYYIMSDWCVKFLKFFPNHDSLRFWRIHNEEILNNDYPMKDGDPVEIYIDKELRNKDEYVSALVEYKTKYKCREIVTSSEQVNEVVDTKEWDLNSMIENEIPDYLKEKFNKISKKL